MNLREQMFPSPRRKPVRFALSCLLGLYALLLAAPGFLFAEHVDRNGIRVYTHHSPTGLDDDLRTAAALTAKSPLDDPALRQNVYLTQASAEYTLFVPSARHGLGATYHLLNHTFLPPSDPVADMVHSDRATLNQRPLSAVLAHERTHTLLEHHFGLLRLLATSTWKQEGYCDYIAGSPSVGTTANGLQLLAQPGTPEPAVLYFRDNLRVRYLLDHDHLTVDQLFQQSFDLARLDANARAFAELNPTQTESSHR
jgi:hypothetical protein